MSCLLASTGRHHDTEHHAHAERHQNTATLDASGSQFPTSLPTITTHGDLDSCMASSSASRFGSSPLSSEPGTPTNRGGPLHHPNPFRDHKQRALADSPGPSNGGISDSPSSSSSWADSLPNLEHRVGPRIAELQSQHGSHGSHGSAQYESAQHSDDRPPGGGVMLLSEVDLDRAQHGGHHAAPSSQVLLTSGRTVTITGNVSTSAQTLCAHALCLMTLVLMDM